MMASVIEQRAVVKFCFARQKCLWGCFNGKNRLERQLCGKMKVEWVARFKSDDMSIDDNPRLEVLMDLDKHRVVKCENEY